MAFLACKIIVLTPALAIFFINLSKYSKSSTSSKPILVLTVTGSFVELTIPERHSATKSGSLIKQAPNLFFWTFLLGQPKFKLISS